MTDCLNIVYFLEPWIELGRPYLRYHNLRYQLGPQISSLSKLGCKITVLMGESTYEKVLQENYYLDNVEFKVIKESELREIFDNYLEGTSILHKEQHTEKQASQYQTLIESKLDFEIPDVFISFLSPVNFLKSKWKDTLFLYTEFGIFSRAPYPRTFYFDTYGIFENSYVRKIENENLILNKSDRDELEVFKNAINMEEAESYLSNELSRFNKNILVPLQFSNYFGFDATSKYKSQYEFLIDTLEKIPEDIGAVITEHTGWEKTINEHNYDYLIKRFPNLIISDKILSLSNASQALIKKVDGIASVSSSVALQGAFWGKPIFAMGNSHINTFNSGLLENATNVINNHNPDKNNAKIHHLIKNYYFTEKYAYNGIWFHNKLTELLNSKNNNTNPYRGEIDKDYMKHMKSNVRNRDYKMTFNKQKNENDKQEQTVLSDFDIVSFDIFDTLIQRPLNMPHQMFLFMQDKVRDIVKDKHFEFHKIRRVCEHKVRKESSKLEISINDIYSQIQKEYNISDENIAEMVQLEIITEMHFCEERVTGKKLFNLAKTHNKQILLVSDFHIHHDDVEKLLRKCGYDGWDKLYVSCDYNKTKKHGSLFEHVLIENNIDPKTIIHIGDNFESDIENAQSFKIKTIHTPKGTDLFFRNGYTRKTWEQEKNRVLYPTESLAKASAAIVGLSINKLHTDLESSDYNSAFHGDANKLGYCLFGPLFTAFALELSNFGKEKEYAFLSRDGSIFMKVFKELFPDYNSKYIYTSRRALSVPTLINEDKLLDSLMIPFNPSPLKKILKNKYGLNESDMEALIFPEDENLTLDSVIHPSNTIVALKKFFLINKEVFFKVANSENLAAKKYLENSFNENSIIVDIGYSGSLQSYIQNLTEKKYPGFYLMTHLKGKFFSRDELNMKGFLGDFIDHTSTTSPYKDRISFLEFICSNDEASLLKYFLNNEEIEFIFKDENVNISRRRIISREIQSGIIEFAKDYKKYFMQFNHEMDLDTTLITQWLFDFLKNPTPIDSKIFNNIDHEDSYSAHDKRYIVSDIERELNKSKGKLSANQAKNLVDISDWKEGARAILPAKRGTKKNAPENPNYVKLRVTPSEEKKVNPTQSLNQIRFKPPQNKTKAKLNKLIRDPKRFFADAIRKHKN